MTTATRPLSARLADGDYEGVVTAKMAVEVRQLEAQRDALLAACEAARDRIDPPDPEDIEGCQLFAQLQAAIAKGRTT